ncbi:HNH endonuclease signature motif containing protein [Vibrio harveyi]|uniref:HNH endonuclease signature motif containing protein n=1 Tax=Vibrio harveyi TaxID=669 RepID=UPI00165D3215|nr:HNH endonuclease signature motif containing protein [Vibrio harveyi]
MFRKVHTLEPNQVIDFYLSKKGISTKHKKNILRIKSGVLSDAKVYQKLSVLNKTHLVKDKISKIDQAAENSLEFLYKTYVKESGVREFIFKQSLLCPGCQRSYATKRSTLDHFLPSSHYPNFYVLPWNLVPTCGDCNRIKNNAIPQSKKDNLPHPYFNSLLFKKNWLKVVIRNTVPLTYEFTFDEQLKGYEKQMVLNHLLAYNLENVFISHISTIFSEHDEDFKEIFEDSGYGELKDYIEILKQEAYVSNSRKKKFWPINIEYAFLSALFESDWFCQNYYL